MKYSGNLFAVQTISEQRISLSTNSKKKKNGWKRREQLYGEYKDRNETGATIAAKAKWSEKWWWIQSEHAGNLLGDVLLYESGTEVLREKR